MEALVDLEATVNSVQARWSITSTGGSTEGDAWVVLAKLHHEQRGQNCDLEERHTVQATPGGDPTASGVSAFHFLLPGQSYRFTLQVEGSATPLASHTVKTASVGRGLPGLLAYSVPKEVWRNYVGEEHALGEWLGKAPEDMLWAFRPEYGLLRSLWLNACFTLPSSDSPITSCPNPRSRYCLDLTKDSRWLQCKKVRRHKADFRLTVNGNYTETFARCGQLHTKLGKGTWITPSLVQALDRCRQEAGALKIYSIELWEKSTGDLAAAVMALSVGDIFHDYTMATMKRDKRSPGAILSKVLGHLLVECGYTLWYWGFKTTYMAEYDEGYGGFLMDSQQSFWPRWKAALNGPSHCDLATRVPPGLGNALDLAAL